MEKDRIKAVRTKFGFTQEVAAIIFDVNHAQLALAESGKRSLPYKVQKKFGEFETLGNMDINSKLASGGNKDFEKTMQEEYKITRDELFIYVEDCDYKVQTLTRKLAPLSSRRELAIDALVRLNIIRNTRKLSKAELIAVKKAEMDARRTLKLVPQSTLDKLTFQIEALEIIGEKAYERINEIGELLSVKQK